MTFVQIAGDETHGAVKHVEAELAHLRQGFGQKVLLHAGRELELFVQSRGVKLENLIAVAKFVQLLPDSRKLVLEACELLVDCGGDAGERARCQRILTALDAQVRFVRVI